MTTTVTTATANSTSSLALDDQTTDQSFAADSYHCYHCCSCVLLIYVDFCAVRLGDHSLGMAILKNTKGGDLCGNVLLTESEKVKYIKSKIANVRKPSD